jgi:hypothetical protein
MPSTFHDWLALPMVGLAVAIVLTVIGARLTTNSANGLLIAAWFLATASIFVLPFVARLDVIPRILWTALFASVAGLGLYQLRWTDPVIVVSSQTEPLKSEQIFSWIWDPLTAEQTSQIVSKLYADGRPHSVTISSMAASGSTLAQGIDEVFGRAKWTHFLRASAPTTELIEGIVIGPDSAAARIIKDALESVGLPVTIRDLKTMAKDSPPDVIVGVKPVPVPLTPVLRDEAQGLGQKLKDLSGDILVFAADRVREEGLLPPRESYAPDSDGAGKWFQRGVNFSNETEALYAMKFGDRATPYLIQLQNMGVMLPFHLQHVEGRPTGLGKWFSAVGDLLVQGKIQEARTVGNNNALWFNQQ